MPTLLLYYGAITLVTFAVWGIDKLKAIQNQWRIPEKVLISLIIAGGALGALMGMMTFRHKTRKTQFWALVFLFLLIHLLFFIYMLTRN